MISMKMKKVALAATLIATTNLAQAIASGPIEGTQVNPPPSGISTYLERVYRRDATAYDQTRLGGWNFGPNTKTWDETVFWGEKFRCYSGSLSCAQSFWTSVATMWSLAIGVTYKQAIVPAVSEISAVVTATAGQTYTDTNTFTVNLRAGQEAQHVRIMPRRSDGAVSIKGVRVPTGRYQQQCKRDGLFVCWEWVIAYEYFNDPNRVAAVMSATKAMANKPITTFYVWGG
jgi:hypothetical protein